MVTVKKLDTSSRSDVRRFTRLPFHLYRDDPLWVPPLLVDHERQLDRGKHPFYEHSNADFFLAVQSGRDVGRIAAIENTRFNQHHSTRKAQFYFFECVDDQEVANVLFEVVFDWMQSRGLDTLIGPKGLGPLDGHGMLVDGFEHRQMMAMMNYNPSYYPRLLENLAFSKEVDFISCYSRLSDLHIPERVHRIAERVTRRSTLRVQAFSTIRELKAWTPRIGQAYNLAFADNWEYYPLSEREIAFVVSTLESIADPRLIKIVLHEQDVVGFLFAFPDLAAALQRSRGRLLPLGILHMLLEMRRTRWVAVNTIGILPEFQGRGGNALLYSEMEKTVRGRAFEYAVLYQVAETATQMRRDLEKVSGAAYKTHRVYTRPAG